MMNSDLLDDLARRISPTIPPGARRIQQNIEKNVPPGLNCLFPQPKMVTPDRAQWCMETGLGTDVGYGGRHDAGVS